MYTKLNLPILLSQLFWITFQYEMHAYLMKAYLKHDHAKLYFIQ